MQTSGETETESDPETDADAFAFAPTLASLQGNLVSEGELYDHHNEASGASDTESEDEFDAEDPFVRILLMSAPHTS